VRAPSVAQAVLRAAARGPAQAAHRPDDHHSPITTRAITSGASVRAGVNSPGPTTDARRPHRTAAVSTRGRGSSSRRPNAAVGLLRLARRPHSRSASRVVRCVPPDQPQAMGSRHCSTELPSPVSTVTAAPEVTHGGGRVRIRQSPRGGGRGVRAHRREPGGRPRRAARGADAVGRPVRQSGQ
jgi:hypothetical protein